jgi:argininosuccinate lyase
MAWFWMFERDRGRLADARKRVNVCPLGSGAVAGSGFAVDREFIASRLGFDGVAENSVDAVSDRDYIAEFLAASSMLMMHLSRMAEDMIVWSSAEFGFVRLSDEYSTGSSMMPQKKNPDSFELIKGKTGRVYGGLFAILTVLKGLPLAYCRDLQEDKEPLFDSIRTVESCLGIAEGAIRTLTFDTGRMVAVMDPSMYATDAADYLTMKGMPFRTAHEIAGRLVARAQKDGMTLAGLPLDVFQEYSDLFSRDVKDLFNPAASTGRRSVHGGAARESLLAQIARAKTVLSKEVG